MAGSGPVADERRGIDGCGRRGRGCFGRGRCAERFLAPGHEQQFLDEVVLGIRLIELRILRRRGIFAARYAER